LRHRGSDPRAPAGCNGDRIAGRYENFLDDAANRQIVVDHKDTYHEVPSRLLILVGGDRDAQRSKCKSQQNGQYDATAQP
jgi:hypothetical protein